jgi:hypothetical protein
MTDLDRMGEELSESTPPQPRPFRINSFRPEELGWRGGGNVTAIRGMN